MSVQWWTSHYVIVHNVEDVFKTKLGITENITNHINVGVCNILDVLWYGWLC